MADIKTKIGTEDAYMRHYKFIEAVCDYRKGWTNLENASKEVAKLSELTPEIAASFLKQMKRNNVTQIRGYSIEPERLRKGKEGKPNQLKRK